MDGDDGTRGRGWTVGPRPGRVVLIDGSGLVHRAFDALPSTLTTPDGQPVNAVFGFARMFRTLLRGRTPSHGAVVYGEVPMPDRLRAQLDGIDAVVDAHGFPVLRVGGAEVGHGPDRVDLLASLCRAALDAGATVTLVSADKAFLPLLADERVRLFDPIAELFLDADRARRRFGTLADPTSLRDDLPVPSGSALVVSAPTPERLNTVYRRFGFVSLLTATAPSRGTPEWFVVDTLPMVAAALQNECCGTDPVALHVLTELDGVFADQVGIALSPRPGRSLYLPFAGPGVHLGEAGLQALRPWLENPVYPKVVHDGRRARVALAQRGITLEGVVGDTALGSHLLDPSADLPHRLEQVARRHLHRGMQPLRGVVGSGRKRRRFDALTIDRAGAWANHQADAIGEAWRVIDPALREAGLHGRLVDVELPLGRLLAAMERTGVLVDATALERLGAGFMAEREEVAAEVHRLAGRTFTIGSPRQLGTVLFDELGLPVVKRTKTGYSTAAAVLDQLDHPIAAAVKRWRTLDTLVNTWTEVLVRSVEPSTGRLHPTHQQTASASGRLITTSPDLQRTPVRTAEFAALRDCFAAAPGHVVMTADWSQIELRLLAHLAADPKLVATFRQGADLHRQTAAALFDVDPSAVTGQQREVGKTVNFATVYGQGPVALSAQLGVPHAVARGFIDRFFSTWSGVAAWRDRTVARAHADGFVTTLGGRRRFVPELSTRTPADRAYGERIAMNTPVQGSAADLCKDAMLLVDRRLREAGLGARMNLQIHDELLFEVPAREVEATTALVREAMTSVWTLAVPLVVEVGVGRSWGAAKEAAG